ncbi:Deoxyguanosinetriphosphate triphosphohydrolase-like protein [Desulfotomaculum nigrificans CO-1-SRB]|uniref:Deoxyguanosinetriphosphate triphosphohydrolase-like protein n=1 Tax=Desulfotomaculum nigrificans (strain DSM 14880 / VKM B-2319 / CO-1-SRB) TaxID=868595 RepID=F6B8D5_DESCC|nr:deoxyguanosinetriphosphate triphosphohydrolase [Desulfotomaculum nigrificans]AEF94699.1 Deoxyguanosinetriphosphate triphosphohydrolase-like protein [Desulfotomaculum nigrificans CO-1-SRB]
MDIRQQTEELERKLLSPYACCSADSKGRERPEEPCPVRTVFQRDRDRIIHCKAFRRLKLKTQVFIIPEGDHYRTRLTHTLEVAQIARTCAKALRLNEDLTEAIALGHDLGHTPFGHAGEQVLAKVYSPDFKHNRQSLRVVDLLEGQHGLNLTWEVRDGILNHTGPNMPATLEGQIVKIADRIAYINHDIDDALRAGVLKEQDLPRDCLEILGFRHSERINTMVIDLIRASTGRPEITMSREVRQAMEKLRNFMFDHVYIGSEAKTEENKARHVVESLYFYFLEHPERMPGDILNREEPEGTPRLVADYIAGMTDRYAVAEYKKIFIPRGFPLHKL